LYETYSPYPVGGNYPVILPLHAFASNFNTMKGPLVYYTSPAFISDLAKSANNFTEKQDLIGAPLTGTGGIPVANIGSVGSQSDYFWIRLNADGCVEFTGTSLFWNNFVIQFSEYGKELFGIHDFVDADNIMAVTQLANNTLVYTMFDVEGPLGQVVDIVGNAAYLPLQEIVRVVGAYPLFKNLEHRYFVSVETDLLVNQAIKVVDGTQTIDRSICKSFFPTTCKVLLESENGILKEDIDFQVETRIGQHSFVKKTEPSRQYTALQTSYDLRFYRFHLYVTYRFFDASNKWIFTRMQYPMDKEDSWTIGLEFVSKI